MSNKRAGRPRSQRSLCLEQSLLTASNLDALLPARIGVGLLVQGSYSERGGEKLLDNETKTVLLLGCE